MANTQKTEQPTHKRIKDARERGEVVKSIELNHFIILTSFFIIFFFIYKNIFYSTINFFIKFYNAYNITEKIDFLKIYTESLTIILNLLSPVLLFVFFVTLCCSFLQTNFNFASKAIGIKFDRINPINGFKKIFSMRSWVELIKSILKITVVLLILFQVLWDDRNKILNMPAMDKYELIKYTMHVLSEVLKRILIFIMILAIVDFLWQRKDFINNLKMTKHEIKEELKQTEGDQKVKAKIKSLHKKYLKYNLNNMVKQATFVTLNPTHYAVAIKYEKGMKAPKLVAKGVDNIAKKIKEIAFEYKIPIITNPELTRKLYYSTAVGKYIPTSLFKAVAKILVMIYKMEKKKNEK